MHKHLAGKNPDSPKTRLVKRQPPTDENDAGASHEAPTIKRARSRPRKDDSVQRQMPKATATSLAGKMPKAAYAPESTNKKGSTIKVAAAKRQRRSRVRGRQPTTDENNAGPSNEAPTTQRARGRPRKDDCVQREIPKACGISSAGKLRKAADAPESDNQKGSIIQVTAGLLVSVVEEKVSVYHITLVGGVIADAGIMASSVAGNITWLSVTLGGLHGLGIGTILLGVAMCLLLCFDKYKATATAIKGIGTVGAGVAGVPWI
ncbi:hypothetical protein HPB50_024184 [Hyalomma asiaticum]|uniref:Uncharacterized protein n=1 Tax=Hyalomma asiaticum TaxID=266040 RepID=A0ACB7SKG8_HYAAI|nr:hypothetical protein HPB50_024184 [Hyalomma asiaticum]